MSVCEKLILDDLIFFRLKLSTQAFFVINHIKLLSVEIFLVSKSVLILKNKARTPRTSRLCHYIISFKTNILC